MSRRRVRTDGRRIHRGVWAWSDAPIDDQLRLRAAALLLPSGGAIGGRSAALLFGVDVRRRDPDVVEIVVDREVPLRPRMGIRIRRAKLDAGDVVRVHGVPVTSPVRTAFDLARLEPRAEAVVCLDALVHADVVALEDVERYTALRPGWRGVRRARIALGLCDGLAESPMETRLRLLLVDGGLPRPSVNETLRDTDGRFLARPDLRIGRVLIEYDGSVHREAGVFARDLRRQNRLVEAGYTVLRYSADDVLHRPHTILAQVRALLLPDPRRS